MLTSVVELTFVHHGGVRVDDRVDTLLHGAGCDHGTVLQHRQHCLVGGRFVVPAAQVRRAEQRTLRGDRGVGGGVEVTAHSTRRVLEVVLATAARRTVRLRTGVADTVGTAAPHTSGGGGGRRRRVHRVVSSERRRCGGRGRVRRDGRQTAAAVAVVEMMLVLVMMMMMVRRAQRVEHSAPRHLGVTLGKVQRQHSSVFGPESVVDMVRRVGLEVIAIDEEVGHTGLRRPRADGEGTQTDQVPGKFPAGEILRQDAKIAQQGVVCGGKVASVARTTLHA